MRRNWLISLLCWSRTKDWFLALCVRTYIYIFTAGTPRRRWDSRFSSTRFLKRRKRKEWRVVKESAWPVFSSLGGIEYLFFFMYITRFVSLLFVIGKATEAHVNFFSPLLVFLLLSFIYSFRCIFRGKNGFSSRSNTTALGSMSFTASSPIINIDAFGLVVERHFIFWISFFFLSIDAGCSQLSLPRNNCFSSFSSSFYLIF